MTRLATIATVLIALLPATAQANNTAEENQDLAVASAYWGTEASCPAASVSIVHYSSPVLGQAPLGGCSTGQATIWLSDDFPQFSAASQVCQLVVHEYGHLLGHQHSDDPASVMFYSPLNASLVPGCTPPTSSRCKSKRYKRNHPNKCQRPLGKVE